ncbi:MAG: hypothetical protein ABH871_10155 [Pseudomonadota bacterium]
MKKLLRLFFLLPIILFSACLNDGTRGTGGTGTLPPLSLEGQVISCEEDLDCAVVELTCCTDCFGDETAVVNKDYENDVKKRNVPTCSSDTACADIWCGYKLPKCVEGICTYEVVDMWEACEIDDDCIIVELGCCDHCNGGRAVAANKGLAELVKTVQGDECEEETMCTLMACAPLLARCTQGKCESFDDPTWGITAEE